MNKRKTVPTRVFFSLLERFFFGGSNLIRLFDKTSKIKTLRTVTDIIYSNIYNNDINWNLNCAFKWVKYLIAFSRFEDPSQLYPYFLLNNVYIIIYFFIVFAFIVCN